MASRGCGTFGPAGAFSLNQAHQLDPTGTDPNIQNIMLAWLHLKRSPMLFSSGQTVLNKNTVELVLLGQRQWEDGGVGKACVNQCVDQQLLRQQTQSLLRGIVNAPSRRARGATSPPGLSSCVSPLCCSVWLFPLWCAWAAPVPSCADIRGTFPSAWTSAQLSRMSQDDLKQCVEVFAQDASMSAEQRRALWVKLRQVSGGGGLHLCLNATVSWIGVKTFL